VEAVLMMSGLSERRAIKNMGGKKKETAGFGILDASFKFQKKKKKKNVTSKKNPFPASTHDVSNNENGCDEISGNEKNRGTNGEVECA
jgi:hypothetical protein